MAETDTPRFGLRQWGAATDTPSRVEFNTAFANIDLLGAIDKQDVFLSRPLPGVRGTYFWDTTNSYLWRDTGTAWSTVGSRVLDGLATASAIGSVALTAAGIAGQTANLFEAKVGAALLASIDKDGNVAGVKFSGKQVDLIGTDIAAVPLKAKGAAGQTGDLLSLVSSTDSNRFKVTSSGVIEAPYFRTSSVGSVVGASASTNEANMNAFTGVALFEMKSSGAGGTFTEFAHLKHPTVDATAVLRRMGYMVKAGGEAIPDAAKTAGWYMESSAANMDNPSLVMFLADTPVFTIPPSGGTAVLKDRSLRVERALSGDNAFTTLVPGDSNSRLLIHTDGSLAWGPGSVVADTNLYRSAANTLKTDDDLVVGSSITTISVIATGQFQSTRPTSGDHAFRANVSGDTFYRVLAEASGKLIWGTGAAAGDTNLYRSAPSKLKTDGAFEALSVDVIETAAANVAYSAKVSGDANPRFGVNADGKLTWGPGATAVDTNLYRSAASTLKTDDSFNVAGTLLIGADCNLYRLAANVLKTDDDLVIGAHEAHSGESGVEVVAFTNQASFTQLVTFTTPFAFVPAVYANINTAPGASSGWNVRAINITTTGFTLYGFGPTVTWTGQAIGWTAFA